jgi:hypothetical protein
MAALVVAVLITIAAGILLGGFLVVSLAIGREDRSRVGSLRFDAPDHSTRTARTLMGISSSRWEE